MRLPDPHTSVAVLIGTADYNVPALPGLPAVRNNLSALAAVLTDPEIGGFTADRCIVLPDPHTVRGVYRSLRGLASTADDTLFLYYAGHGLTGPQNELYLSLADTDPDELVVSALPYTLIREIVEESPAANRVVVLDCCFSGRAIPGMTTPEESFAGQVSIEGTYTLTSTAANAVALAPEGASFTAFTGELLRLLRNGLPHGHEFLTFGTVYRELLRTMVKRNLPRPMNRGTGTVDQLAIARNRRFEGLARGESTPARALGLDVDPGGTHSTGVVVPAGDFPTRSTGLVALARRQCRREMELLIGTTSAGGDVLDHQHLPALYVDRPAMREAWSRFLLSGDVVFSAVGEAGRGKTSFLCMLATELAAVSPVLFYHGSQLDGPLTDALAHDLELPVARPGTIQEIARQAADRRSTLFVVIDALNERAADRDSLRRELNDLARDIRTNEWPIRIVVSCRAGDWLFWVRNARHMLGHFGRAVYRDEILMNSSMPGTPVAAFRQDEMRDAWRAYKKGFALGGELPHRLRPLIREPIFLRLIAEMYRGTTPALERTTSRGALIDRFFSERFPDGSDSIEVMAFLYRVSELVLERQRPSVPVSALHPADLPACRRLLVEGVLTEKNGTLAFRFEMILEHVVAQYLRQQLPDRPEADEVAALVAELSRSRLVNSPGIVENLLLALRDRPEAMLRTLRSLASHEDRWRAVACSVAAELDLPPRRLLPAVKILAASDNYLIRTLSADTLVGWIDR
ncbi:caspase family protein [Streptomyces argenteolus]|uniref:Caspase family protein n=1 Tax=Streptomyces argenteolus TaxID=67274 RepID=A0ABW6X774_9ACTN